MMQSNALPTIDDVASAAERLSGVAVRTPLISSAAFGMVQSTRGMVTPAG